jgi:hypothetical protein
MPLNFPQELREEFATVGLIAESKAATRGVDSLLLAWIKYEKQTRKLFSFLIYQHPVVHASDMPIVVDALVKNRNLYPDIFLDQLATITGSDLPSIIGPQHGALSAEIARIKPYRNKLAHGQISGLHLTTAQLLTDVGHIASWMSALATGAQARLGYDGLRRDSFTQAKSVPAMPLHYPFNTVGELATWIAKLGAKSGP